MKIWKTKISYLVSYSSFRTFKNKIRIKQSSQVTFQYFHDQFTLNKVILHIKIKAMSRRSQNI